MFSRYSKYANLPNNDITNLTEFWWTTMKKDISANLNLKCLILCSRILLDMLHNMRTSFLLAWQHTGSRASRYLELASHLCSFFYICQGSLISTIQQSYKMLGGVCGLVKSFLSLKSPNILKSAWGGWKRVSCYGNPIFLQL